jgi:5-methyltetrahydrofolate--homocysteine methyltransferase
MRDAIRFLGEHSPAPIHCIPNAGIPHQGPNGETIFPETPDQISTVLGEFVERYGVNIVGGCCGTTPDHIRHIAEAVAGLAPRQPPQVEPRLRLSGLEPLNIGADSLFLNVGERTNVTGSAKFRRLIEADD